MASKECLKDQKLVQWNKTVGLVQRCLQIGRHWYVFVGKCSRKVRKRQLVQGD